MSKISVSKPDVGRQSQLPFNRALRISLNSLKIRFWRSIITAGGIFLGIAFLTTVLTQGLMQWPVPEKVDAGYVRVGGQVTGPGDCEVWKRIPVEKGLQAGISKDVIETVAEGKSSFSLAAIVQGRLDAKRADKNLARVKREWVGLRKIDKSFYGEANKDKDINLNDARKNGVPDAIARHLAGEGKTFKGSALADAVKIHPKWIKIWQSRADKTAIYKTVDQAVIDKLGEEYAITLGEALKDAKGLAVKTADQSNLMITNENGRRIGTDLTKGKAAQALTIKLQNGDNVFVPDLNTKYRLWWLVAMSLLVCTVGITNSMLMSVTERFKEIGTMKCLGALDSFVVTLFMLESGMMGVVASVMGAVLGFVAMIVIAGFTKGWVMVANIELLSVLKVFVFAVGAGLVITMIATIAPALRAANMPAAMALRSEI